MKLVADPIRGVNGSDLHADIGALRDRITLLSIARSKSAGGWASDAPTTVATVAAEVVADASAEPYEANGLRGETTYRVRLRYRSDVRSSWRITWRDLTLQLLAAPIADARRRFLWLRCGVVEGAAA